MARAAAIVQLFILFLLLIGQCKAQTEGQQQDGEQETTGDEKESECKKDVWDNYLLRPAGRGGGAGTIRDLILERGTACRKALADKTKEVFGPASVS